MATGALLSFGGFHLLSVVHYLPFHTSVHLCFSFIWGLGLCRGSEVLGLPRSEASEVAASRESSSPG